MAGAGADAHGSCCLSAVAEFFVCRGRRLKRTLRGPDTVNQRKPALRRAVPARRLFCVLAVLLVLALAGTVAHRSTAALAHAVLVRSDPAAGSVRQRPPASVRLWFSEPVLAAGAAVTATAPDGYRADRGSIRINGALVELDLDAQAPGSYRVSWQVLSRDTHAERGRFEFAVQYPSRPAATQTGDLGSVAPLGLFLQTLARALYLGGVLLTVGPIAFLALVLRSCRDEANAGARTRLLRLAGIGIPLLLIAEPLALLALAASLPDRGLFDFTVAAQALTGGVGRVLGQRAGGALLLWVLLLAAGDGSDRAVWGLLAASAGLALVDAQTAHVTGPWLILTALHVLAASIWAGGLLALVTLWPLPPLRPLRSAMLARFSRLALAAAVLTVLSGFGLAAALAPARISLESPYVRVLALKILLVLGALALAPLASRRSGVWKGEMSALTGVIVVAALLVSLPPR